MNRVLWMNSGGKDSTYVLEGFQSDPKNKDVEIIPYLLETDFLYSNMMARHLTMSKNMKLIEVPYAETRRAIAATNSGVTVFWAMECQYRAVQYALQIDCDFILSGSTNVYAREGRKSTEFEKVLEEIQDFLEVPKKSQVTLSRPIKEMIERDLRNKVFDREFKEKKKKGKF